MKRLAAIVGLAVSSIFFLQACIFPVFNSVTAESCHTVYETPYDGASYYETETECVENSVLDWVAGVWVTLSVVVIALLSVRVHKLPTKRHPPAAVRQIFLFAARGMTQHMRYWLATCKLS